MMSTEASLTPTQLIIIDKKTKSLDDVRARIVELKNELPGAEEAYTTAASRRNDLRNELDTLESALTAGGFPIQPYSQE